MKGLTFEQLKRSPFFHNADPSDLNTIEDWTAWLEAILHNPCSIWNDNGEDILIEIRHLIARVNGLKIEIYPNEHPPPHFHVVSANLNVSFAIEDCRILAGEINSQDLKKISYWHKHAKHKLISCWNTSRPTDCVVGRYVENR